MIIVEIVLSVIAYTLISISIFLGIICYRKNIESWETIALMFSLLLLIISITVSAIWSESSPNAPANIFILLSMILVGLTTPLNVMVERQHSIPDFWKKVLYAISSALFLLTILAYFSNTLNYMQYVVPLFLGISIISFMILIRVTKPQKRLQHLEKSERIFALVFLLMVPLFLFISFSYEEANQNLKIGFTLPLVFILLSANKIWDDLQRLSILKSNVAPKEQQLKNFLLTNREKEIARMFAKGSTYKQISEELHISIPTVKTHASNIYKKCGVKNKAELILLLIN